MNIRTLIALAMSFLTTQALAQTALGNGLIQVARYTTQNSAPEESLADPLMVYAHLTYPRQSVSTVGDALSYTLLRTGFRMVPTGALDEKAQNFLSLPLPESQRRMGPHKVIDLLKTLLGPAWQLQSDPVSRQVWFSPRNMTRAKPEQLAPTVVATPPQAAPPPKAPVSSVATPTPSSQPISDFKETQRKFAAAIWHLGDAKDLKTLIQTWAAQDGRKVSWLIQETYPIAGRLNPGWAFRGEFTAAIGNLAAAYGRLDTPFSLTFEGRDLVIKPVQATANTK